MDRSKSHFARHGVPDKVITDNGPQFIAHDYETFARDWEFDHITSSPYHSQSNGKAEATVKIAKKIIKKTKSSGQDLYLGILDWRNTPSDSGTHSSPVQKLMSRRTNTLLPTPEGLLYPQVVHGVSEEIKHRKQKAKLHYDKGTKPLPELEIGQQVRIQPNKYDKEWTLGHCTAKVGPRSYLVQNEYGQTVRRNRKFLRTSEETMNFMNSANSHKAQPPCCPPTSSVQNKFSQSKSLAKPTPAMKPTYAATPTSAMQPTSAARPASTAKPTSAARPTTKQTTPVKASRASQAAPWKAALMKQPASPVKASPSVQPPLPAMRATRSRAHIKPPERYKDYVK